LVERENENTTLRPQIIVLNEFKAVAIKFIGISEEKIPLERGQQVINFANPGLQPQLQFLEWPKDERTFA
jgi:hypothetical protein